MVKERPLWGKGWGCFELFYPFYQGGYMFHKMNRTLRTHANNAHNIVMEIWSQVGIVGMGILSWLLLLTVFFACKNLKRLNSERRLEAVALLAAWVGMLADNFFGNVSLFFAVPAFLTWWQLGLLFGIQSENAQNEYRLSFKSSRLYRTLTLFGCMACLFLMVRFYRHWQAEVHYFTGFKASKRNDLSHAVKALETSHRYRRFEVNSNYEMGNVYARQLRVAEQSQLADEVKRLRQKTLWAYDEALRANSGYDEIYFNKATVLAQENQLEAAIQNYRTSLGINPMSYEAYTALINVYLNRVQRFDEAIPVTEQALKFFPRDRDLWNNLGFLYTKLEKHQEALEAYAHALRLDATFSLAWNNFRIALRALGKKEHPLLQVPSLLSQLQDFTTSQRYREALPVALRLKELIPENIRLRTLLGRLYRAGGQREEAKGEFRWVLKQNPHDSEAQSALRELSADGTGARD